MESMLDDLFLKFEAKGFLPVEIPDLLKDVIEIANKKRHVPISLIEQELEELGWGLGVLDTSTYDLITLLKTSVENPSIETQNHDY